MNAQERAVLQQQMASYYANTVKYHQNIDDTVPENRPSEEEKILFRALMSRLQTNQRPFVVELGCGRGAAGAGFVEMLGGAEYLGIDASPSAVDVASKRYPQMTFRVGDIGSMSFAKAPDIVFANYVLEHTVYPEKIFEAVSGALNTGGLFGLILPVGDFPWEIPPSTRDRRLDIPFRTSFTAKRVLRQLMVRYRTTYLETHLVADPVALRDPNWIADDDLVYWASGVELEKLGRLHGLQVQWSYGRPLPPLRPGNRLDSLRRYLSTAWERVVAPGMDLTSSLCVVFRKA